MNDFGVNILFDPTQVTGTREAKSAYTCAVGRAPMANAYGGAGARAANGRFVMCTSLADFKNKFGWSEDFLTYELCGVAHVYFSLFSVNTVAFNSALDTEVHTEPKQSSIVLSQRFGRPRVTDLEDFGAVTETIQVFLTDQDEVPVGEALVPGEDYTLGINAQGYSFIRPVLGGAIFPVNPAQEDVTVAVSYDVVTPGAVTNMDIIDALEDVRNVYPKLHNVPQLLIAPGWSRGAGVSDALVGVSSNINGIFNANSLTDIDSTGTGARDYEAAAQFKDKNGQSDATQKPCWPCRRLDDEHIIHFSTVLAGLVASMEANIGAPSQTESNQTLPGMGMCLEDGTPVSLGLDEANWLRGYGIATGLFWDGADRAWGAYSGAAPSSTDPAELFWTTNRWLRWYGNNLALTWFQKVDVNITRRLIDHIVATENDRLRQYNAQGWCPVGEIFFPEELNSNAQLAMGHIVFKAKPSAYLPAQRIDFHIELDLQPFFDELRGDSA